MARYFPIERKPLRMVASLARFGTDFGQGELDQRFFQVDERYDFYIETKRAAPAHRRFVVDDDSLAHAANREALTWMEATLAREHPALALPAASSAPPRALAARFDALACRVQEDFVVLNAGPDDVGRVIAADVRFPSGWHPERLPELGFAAIHAPVPGFPAPNAIRGMIRAMVDRGPYVRFVWTVGADDHLDQHPELARTRGRREDRWAQAARAFLRVERQVTVPLPETRSCVFLVRTHLRALEELNDAERATLREALRVMPDEVRRYKSLPPYAELARFLS